MMSISFFTVMEQRSGSQLMSPTHRFAALLLSIATLISGLTFGIMVRWFPKRATPMVVAIFNTAWFVCWVVATVYLFMSLDYLDAGRCGVNGYYPPWCPMNQALVALTVFAIFLM